MKFGHFRRGEVLPLDLVKGAPQEVYPSTLIFSLLHDLGAFFRSKWRRERKPNLRKLTLDNDNGKKKRKKKDNGK